MMDNSGDHMLWGDEMMHWDQDMMGMGRYMALGIGFLLLIFIISVYVRRNSASAGCCTNHTTAGEKLQGGRTFSHPSHAVKLSPQSRQLDQISNFCSNCGFRLESSETRYCPQCGVQIV